MLKKIIFSLAFLVVLVFGVGVYFFYNLDSFAKQGIEVYGSRATQTKVSVDQVQLHVSTGNGTIKGLSVGNPEGFSAPKAFAVSDISIDIDPNSVTSKKGPIIIRSLVIKHPQVTYEITNGGENNLGVISQNAKKFADSFQKPSGKNAAPTTPAESSANADKPEEGGRKIIVRELTLSEGQVSITHKLLQKEFSATLPAIHLKNLGADNGGATPSELAQILIGAISSEASKAAANSLSKELLNMQGAGAAKKIEQKLRGKLGF